MVQRRRALRGSISTATQKGGEGGGVLSKQTIEILILDYTDIGVTIGKELEMTNIIPPPMPFILCLRKF